MFKIFYEDIEVGHKDTFGNYPVTKEEIIDFASKYDPQPFHLHEDFAKQSVFGGLCASGWHTCSMMMRMMVDRMMENGLAGLGSPGLDTVAWKRPVFPGDTLSVCSTITEKRVSKSRPNMGLVKAAHEVLNQDGIVVTEVHSNLMVARRKGA